MQYGYAYQLGERAGGLDPDAKAYILAVEAADGQTLESGVKKAYNTFVKGCKSDGIWGAIKASCILAGARTLSGALVPLKGTAPTNFNFVSGDYGRKTGLIGNGSTKYLSSNRANNADPQNNHHHAIYISSVVTGVTTAYIGAGGVLTGATGIYQSATSATYRSRVNLAQSAGSQHQAGFGGINRNLSTSFEYRRARTNTSATVTSQTASSDDVFIFARNNGSNAAELFTSSRISFYSIGESVDLAKLDSRVSRLVAELAFTINTGLIATPYDIDTLKYINAGYEAGGTLA